MLFSLLKHYFDYMIDTALKVSQSLYCFTTFMCHGVENYFPRLWGTGIFYAVLLNNLSVSLPVFGKIKKAIFKGISIIDTHTYLTLRPYN